MVFPDIRSRRPSSLNRPCLHHVNLDQGSVGAGFINAMVVILRRIQARAFMGSQLLYPGLFIRRPGACRQDNFWLFGRQK